MIDYPRSETQEKLVRQARRLAAEFAPRAAQHDREASFPFENIAALRREGFPALSVPERLGGWGATLLESCMVIEELARGDGSTALSFTMHVQTVGDAAESQTWPAALFERLCREAVSEGALVNAVASEPELGSPSRGGLPKTTATPLRGPAGAIESWRIDGRKSWASMSPALTYMVVSAAVLDGEGGSPTGETARFLVPAGPGVEILETWDAIGMRATGSHDVLLRGVCVPDSAQISRGMAGPVGNKGGSTNAWFALTAGAVYVGVAQAALDAACAYAHERVPSGLGKPIAQLESIQRAIGQGLCLVQQARLVLHRAAELWQRTPDRQESLAGQVAVAKLTATNNAVAAVDHALRVAGAAGLSRALPLERYYRDVRAGLAHPLSDDAVYLLLGRAALGAAAPNA